MHRPILLALIAAAAVLATGCGGDSGGSTSAGLTKPQFIARADAICRKADEAQTTGLAAYSKEHPSDKSSKAGQEKMITSVGLPPVREEIAELSKLEAPSGDQAEIDAIIKAIEEAVSKGEDEPSILLNPSTGAVAEASKLAGEYGFKVCNNPL